MILRTLFLSLNKTIKIPVGGRTTSFWSKVPMGPPDPILGITEAYKLDPNLKKINLGVGAYRDDDGNSYVLPVVKKAEERIIARGLNKEYLPIAGDPEFCKLSIKLALGDKSEVVANNMNATVQALSGTGSLRIGAAFIKAFYPEKKKIYLPIPSWGNHIKIFNHAGLETGTYTYLNYDTLELNFKGLLDSISELSKHSIILLHASAHNPTGVDPNMEQWREISALVKKKALFTFFDMAYQGFASGNVDQDAFAVRQFVKDGNPIGLAQSYAKNMGLYGERIGAFTATCASKEETAKVMSQLKILIRPMYSNPPLQGMRIVKEILKDDTLKSQWLQEVKGMADRIKLVRTGLREHLSQAGSKRKWNHITDQIGMFCYTGLVSHQVEKLINKYSIFLTEDGRISMAGVTSKNVDYLANSMHEVTRE